MKHIYFFLFFFVFINAVKAQVCTFGEDEVDSMVVISPAPFDEEINPDGGIDQPACINEEYEFRFILFPPEMVEIPPISATIDSFRIVEGGVEGLPDGLDVETNNPNGTFFPNQADCLVIKGTPTSNNAPGNYDLRLAVTVWIRGLGEQTLNLPDPNITGPGTYTLELREQGQCLSSNSEQIAKENEIKLINNPVTTDLNIEIEATKNSQVSLQLISMFGHSYLNQLYQVYPGKNKITVDCRNLNQGLYFLRYKDQNQERTLRFYVVKP